jgi:hypothetical protein
MDIQNWNWSETLCFGIAGNMAGHLEQAGEAEFFSAENPHMPKGIFASYLPGAPHRLGVFPVAEGSLEIPEDQDKVQIEPELALVGSFIWNADKCQDLQIHGFCAYNDVSIRDPKATKISHKKNWGAHSKGFGPLLALPPSPISKDPLACLNHWSIASFHRRQDSWIEYGIDSEIGSYMCFGNVLLNWIQERFENQKDEGQLENLNELLVLSIAQERQKDQRITFAIGCGATRYTPWGESEFLRSGDAAAVAIYDPLLWNKDRILQSLSQGSQAAHGLSLLVQEVQYVQEVQEVQGQR